MVWVDPPEVDLAKGGKIILAIFSAEVGGGEKVALTLAREYRKRGFDAEILCFTPGTIFERFKQTGVPISALGMRSPFDVTVVLDLFSYLQAKKPTVFHANHPVVGMFGNPVARLLGVPAVVTTMHVTVDQFYLQKDTPRKRFLTKLRYFLAYIILSIFADKLIAVAKAVEKELVQKFRVPKEKILLCYNGIDTSVFSRYKSRGGSDNWIVGTVARISPEKGLHFLVQAIPAILEIHENVEFWFIGNVKEGQESYFSYLQDLCDQNQISKKVRFLGFREDVAALLSQIDLFVLPTLAEGLGLAILEAMAVGKPIITTSVGGVPEVITHGETGILVEPEDPGALAEAVVSLLRDPALCEKLGENACKEVKARFSIENMVNTTLQVYQMVLAAKWGSS